MSNGYNPYRSKNGQFKSGPRRIQYASSDERDDALEATNVEPMKDKQIKASKKQALEQELEECQKIMADPYESPFLKEKAQLKARKLKDKLDKM